MTSTRHAGAPARGRGTSGQRRAGVAPTRGRADAAKLAAAAAARGLVQIPTITFPEELPVSARRADIAAAIRDHQVVIVSGETGSGKTTQIPKIALELGRGRAGQIGHTQPRRIAARAVAERIAEELGTTLGDIVGYQVRFTQQASERTLIKVMTDGILLAQIQHDPELRAYDTLIIDEAHERSLNIDFLLGYLTNLLPRRPDLKVIITSATIDSERFARHFAPRGVQSDRHSAPGGPVPDHSAVPPTNPADAVATESRSLAPVVAVTGRTYPVAVRYRPLAGATKGDEKDLMTGIVEACDELMREGHGDILVFLSGEREIRDAVEALEGHLGARVRDARHPQAVELLPLYSRLSAAEQHRVFASHSARRIVLATNVAETSLTVPGVHYVVDPGTARISRYSKATKVQRLPIEPISQASARQRAGRAGRLANGIAIRLYAEDDFEGRPAFTEPEILRTSLASVLLHMISVGVVSSLDDVASFPFVESPDTRSIRDGLQLLTDLGAVTTGRGGTTRLTEVGRALARLPLDPRQARMIVEGAKHSVAYECAIIAAALSIQDPRERPSERRAEADLQHRRFSTPKSDILAYLNLWAYLRERQHELSGSAFRRLCRSEYLNYLRVREWQDLVQQLRDAAKPVGIAIKPRRHERAGKTDDAAADAGAGAAVGAPSGAASAPSPSTDAEPSFTHSWNEDAIHRSVLAGLLTQIGIQDISPPKASSFSHLRGDARASAMRKAARRAPNEFLGARGVRFAIQPGSPLSKKPPAFVMAAELVETNRLWARDVAEVNPAWAEELAGDLAKRSYSEPHWSTRQGAAMAQERVTLYGVPLVADRVVLWAKVNPAEARELFIRNALIEGEWTTHHAFFAENRRLLEEASEIEARSRTRGLVADEESLFEFYDDRIPDEVVSARHFDSWWKGARRATPDLLTFTRDLLLPEAPTFDAGAFPDAWPHGDLTLPVTYQFAPGDDADGVTVHVPLAVLPQVSEDGFDWLVPGLLEDLTTATIRALPKPVRRLLVPAPDVARDIVAWIGTHGPSWEDRVRARAAAEPYRAAFTRAARDLRAVEIPSDAWVEVDERLPSHLHISFRVTETTNRREATIEESRNLALIRRNLSTRTAQAVRNAVRAGAPASHGLSRGEGVTPRDATPGPRPSPAPKGTGGIHERDSLTSWPTDLPSGALPAVVESDIGGGTIARGYPTIVEEAGPRGATAALRVLADSALARAGHARGVRRLLLIECALQDKRVTTRWTGAQALALAASPYRSTATLVEDLQLAAVTALTTPGPPGLPRGGAPDAGAVRDADAYAAAVVHVRQHLEDDVFAMVARVIAALDASRELDAAVRGATSMSLLATLADVRALASDLVGEGFISRTPASRLKDLPRYLRAATHRIAKAQENPARDAELAWRVREVTADFDRVRSSVDLTRCEPERIAELDRVRWMVEEYRVSLFAQHLGTDGPVSDKRIRAALAAFASAER